MEIGASRMDVCSHIKPVWGCDHLSDQVTIIDLSARHSCSRSGPSLFAARVEWLHREKKKKKTSMYSIQDGWMDGWMMQRLSSKALFSFSFTVMTETFVVQMTPATVNDRRFIW